MPLILAIVADHHQAAQLTALIKRLNVDLVQAAEVGEGLLALNDRIPDLVLTSPLMSPFDDGVLDEYLRDLGSAGAHVQSLRIPVLSTSTKKSKRGGFSLFGRAKETHTLEGCDPKVFADEITQYLIRAAEEKHNAEANQAPPASDLPKAVPGEEWSTTPGPGPVEAEEKWDPLAWQANARSAEADSPAPLYNPIESPSAFSSVEGDSPYRSFEGGETTAPEELRAADAPAADIYVPEPAIEAPPPLILPEVEPPAAPVFDATAYTPIEEPAAPIEEPAALIEEPAALIEEEPAALIEEEPAAPIEEEPAVISALVALPEDPIPTPSPDPDEPVVRAPLSLFAGVEATTDPASFLPSIAEPTVRKPLTLFGGVEATTDPTEHLQSIVAEPIVPEPIIAEPIIAEPIIAEPIAAEPLAAETMVAEPMVAEPMVAEPMVTEPMVAEPMAAEPMVAEPMVAEPMAAEPIVSEPVAAEPIVAEPMAAEPIVAEPMVAEPIAAAPPEPETTSVPLSHVPSIEEFEVEAPTPETTSVLLSHVPSIEEFEVEAPTPEPVVPVVAPAAPDAPAAPPASPPPVAEKHAPKLTASFRSALAAIRAAWDAPAKPKTPVVEKPTEPMASAKAEAAIPVKVASQGILGLREAAPIEAPPAIEPLVAAERTRLPEPEDEASDVYELTVEPDLQELESKLLAPLKPRVARPSPSEEPAGRASETRSGEGRGTKDAARSKRGKSKKGNKAASAKPRRQDKGPVQDEWGIFDPDRCGFAALVDKLEEVSEEASEEKEQTPRKGTKVRVISYS